MNNLANKRVVNLISEMLKIDEACKIILKASGQKPIITFIKHYSFDDLMLLEKILEGGCRVLTQSATVYCKNCSIRLKRK